MPLGLTRVESHVLRGAIELSPSCAAFCKVRRQARFAESVSRVTIESLLAEYGMERPAAIRSVKAENLIKRAGRRLERSARILIRGPLQHVRQWIPTRGARIRFQPGDALVVSGSTWDTLDPVWLQEISEVQGVRLIAILADMIPWRFPHHFHDRAAVESFLKFAAVLARHATMVTCISRATQSDFLQFAESLGEPCDNTEVMFLGSDPPGKAVKPVNLPDDLNSRSFVLSVSTIQVRKNHQLLYQLWRRFAEEGRDNFPRLVLVGTQGWLTRDLRLQLESDPLVRNSIIVLNNVGDLGLNWLYQNCLFTLYPSLYEGWGLPIIESLQHGKPCIASNTSSMPEAGQNLATHLDPLDFSSWRKLILDWTTNLGALAAVTEKIRHEFKPRRWSDFSREFINRIIPQPANLE